MVNTGNMDRRSTQKGQKGAAAHEDLTGRPLEPARSKENTMRQSPSRFVAMLRDTRAATAIEYGLIAALIAVAATVAMGNLGNTVKSTFNNASTKMALVPTA